jgi:Flp pilus assembly protein TadG
VRAGFPTLPWRRLRGDEGGVAAIEFALVVPIVIVVYLVGFEVTEASTASRKLTDTTVQLANVSAQYTSMSCTDMTNVLDATAQIMTPYPTAKLTSVLSEVSVNSSDVGTVVWSTKLPAGTTVTTTGLTAGTTVAMPAGYQSASSGTLNYYMMAQTTYSYQPSIGAAFVGPGTAFGPISMQDQIFMLPRASLQIPSTCT